MRAERARERGRELRGCGVRSPSRAPTRNIFPCSELLQIGLPGRSADPLQIGKARDEDYRADDHKNKSGVPRRVFLSMLQRSATVSRRLLRIPEPDIPRCPNSDAHTSEMLVIAPD
jgi:hypothetical protein